MRRACGAVWGRDPGESDSARLKRWERELGVPAGLGAAGFLAAARSGTLQAEIAQSVLDRVPPAVAGLPANAAFARFAQTLALDAAALLAGALEAEWAPAAAAAAPAPIPEPAPGWHDARAFPELDLQPLPRAEARSEKHRIQNPPKKNLPLARLCLLPALPLARPMRPGSEPGRPAIAPARAARPAPPA